MTPGEKEDISIPWKEGTRSFGHQNPKLMRQRRNATLSWPVCGLACASFVCGFSHISLGEEPEWVNNLLLSQTDYSKLPPQELDPKIVGYKYKAKRIRTEKIKLKNYLLSKGNFRVLGKPSRRKMTAP